MPGSRKNEWGGDGTGQTTGNLEFIRIRLKIEQNCRLFLDIFNSAVINALFMTFTSRLKVDVRCAV